MGVSTIGRSAKNPRCRIAQPKRKTTAATSVAAAAKPASAGRDELALGVVMSRRRLDAPAAGRQHGERHEREEPRDVEVEPVRQGELEADQDRSGKGPELQRSLAPRHEVARDRAGDEQADREWLEEAEVRNPGRV